MTGAWRKLREIQAVPVLPLAAAAFALVLAVAATGSGCGRNQLFNSAKPLGDGVRGKNWGDVYFVDTPAATPAVNGEGRTFNSLDTVVTGGVNLHLVTTVFDSVGPQFKGYDKVYTDGVGWAARREIAASAGDLANLTLATGPNQEILATFFEDLAPTAVTALYADGWQPARSAALTHFPGFDSTVDKAYDSGASSAFDQLGRAFLFFAATNFLETALEFWEPASNITPANEAVYSYDNDINSRAIQTVTAKFDGDQRICMVNENVNNGPRQLYARCLDTLLTAPGVPVAVPAIPPSGSFTENSRLLSAGANPTQGFDVATNGAGKIMVVFHEKVGAHYRVKAVSVQNGVWQAAATDISAGMPANFDSLPAFTGLVNTRPGVAYMGNGHFMAAWAGVDKVSHVAQLFYALYDGTWKPAAPIADSASYSVVPPYESLHLFSNQDGDNAGIAVNFTGGLGTGAAHFLQVARYQTRNGWLPIRQRGKGCTPGLTLAACTMRPRGVILPSGNTIVFFQDQDESLKFRLGAVDFK